MMHMLISRWWCVVVLAALLAGGARAQVIYTSNFAAPGPEWTNAKTEQTPYYRNVLGRYGNETARLTLRDLPPHTYISLTVEAAFIGPWAGNSPTEGPNVWSLRADEDLDLVRASFSTTSARQTYPQFFPNGEYAARTRQWQANMLGYPGGDSNYRFTFLFPHVRDEVTLDFSALGLKNQAQRWALTRVQVALSHKHPANTVVNSDFESPAVLSPWVYPAGSNVPGWTIADGKVLWVNNGTWRPASGEMSVDLSAGEPATIRQNVPVGGGQHFNIRFAMSGNPNAGDPVKRLQVLWGGNSLGIVEFDTTGKTPTDMGWQWHQFTVEAPVALTWVPLEFRSLNPGMGGPVLDAVSVIPVVAGDVNNDGVTDLLDVVATLRMVDGLDPGNPQARYRADVAPWAGTETRVHGDGTVDMADALLMLRMANTGLTIREHAVAAVNDLVRKFWVGTPTTGRALNTWNGYYTSGNPSLWERSQFMSVIEDFYQTTGDPVLRSRVTADWNYLLSRFTFSGLQKVGPGSVNGWSDDAGWAAIMYLNTYRSTGITQALEAAKGIYRNSMTRWLDDTWGGGLWYTDGRTQKAIYQASHILAGFRIWDATGDTYFRDTSLAMYNWVESHLLRDEGLYIVDFVGDNNPAGKPSTGPPKEASSGTFLGGNMTMAVIHARLWRATGDPIYLQRALRTAEAIKNIENDGYGHYMNDRDAWTESFFMGEWVAEVLTLPGIGPEHAEMLRRTARAVYHRARTPEGYYGASWSGPSMGAESVWYATNSFMPTQINISSNSVHVIVAAAGIGIRSPETARPFPAP